MAAKKSVAGSSAPLHAWLAEQDVAGVMTTRGLKLVSALARKGLQDAKANIGDLPPEAKFVEGMIDSLQTFVKSIESDVTHVALGGRVDAAGNAHMNARALFGKGSGFAKGAKGVKGMEGTPLAGLPAGAFVFAMEGALPGNVMQRLSNWSLD